MARITVEDCLLKERNRFALVQMASKRTKQILASSKSTSETKGNKPVVTSLREIADGTVRWMTAEDRARIDELAALRAAENHQIVDAPVEALSSNGNGHGHTENGQSSLSESVTTESILPTLEAAPVIASDAAAGSKGDDEDDDEKDDDDEPKTS